MRPELYRTKRPHISDILVISVLTVALFVVAYEVASALAVGYVLFVVVLALRRRVSASDRSASSGGCLSWRLPLSPTPSCPVLLDT